MKDVGMEHAQSPCIVYVSTHGYINSFFFSVPVIPQSSLSLSDVGLTLTFLHFGATVLSTLVSFFFLLETCGIS